MRISGKKLIIKLILFTAVLIFFCPVGPEAASAGNGIFSKAYRSGIYYRRLKKVKLTGNYRKDILAVAASQLGYAEGFYENDLSGEGPSGSASNYSEYGWYFGTNGSSWCSEFVSWCARQAKIPESILGSSTSASFRKFGGHKYMWKDTIWCGGDAAPRKGDLVLFIWDSTGTTRKSAWMDHTALITGVSKEKDSSGRTVVRLDILHGNGGSPGVSEMSYYIRGKGGSVYWISSGNKKGKIAYIISPEYQAPPKQKITRVKPSQRSVTVYWTGKKHNSSCGYSVMIAADSKFRNIVKSAGCGTSYVARKMDMTISGLKRRTKYYVRVRIQCRFGKDIVNGPWSKAVSFMTKA